VLKALRLVLLAAGLACMAYLVARTGLAQLVEPIRSLSWWLLPVVAVPYFLVTTCHAAAWRLCFERPRPPFGRLTVIRLAGEAFNTMAAAVGGEPVKAMLLRPAVPLDRTVAALVIDKTVITMAQLVFLTVGLVIARASLPLPPAFLDLMTWLLWIEVVAVGGFVLVQTVEVVGRGLAAMARALRPALLPRIESLRRFERTVAAFYRGHPARLGAVLLWHLLGWAVASLEVYTVLRVLGVDITLSGALVLEAFTTAVRFLSFMVPANVGALEAGAMVAFEAFGLGAGLGLAVSLLRRLRQLVWIAIGLACLAALRHPFPADR
jgi:uncharacterized protein (TIRG00374 family)